MRESEMERYVQSLCGALSALPHDDLEAVAGEILACHGRDRTVFLVGNGGSAATASHFACDLSKGTRQPGIAPFRTVALTDNVPLLTAWGNDAAFERIFAEQIVALVRAGDVVLAISASGNSPNVLEAMRAAREAGACTIAWTGRTGGEVASLADTVVRVPADSMEEVEDAHMVMAHALTVQLRVRLRERVAG
jgi:D-sedoheptulose 7-phosphate isomerase